MGIDTFETILLSPFATRNSDKCMLVEFITGKDEIAVLCSDFQSLLMNTIKKKQKAFVIKADNSFSYLFSDDDTNSQRFKEVLILFCKESSLIYWQVDEEVSFEKLSLEFLLEELGIPIVKKWDQVLSLISS
jgi:hypothetical protein